MLLELAATYPPISESFFHSPLSTYPPIFVACLNASRLNCFVVSNLISRLACPFIINFFRASLLISMWSSLVEDLSNLWHRLDTPSLISQISQEKTKRNKKGKRSVQMKIEGIIKENEHYRRREGIIMEKEYYRRKGEKRPITGLNYLHLLGNEL